MNSVPQKNVVPMVLVGQAEGFAVQADRLEAWETTMRARIGIPTISGSGSTSCCPNCDDCD